jgi:UPF0271 protein
MPTIDLNCDLGEGAGHDAELMPLITSANIACGAHAGSEATMRATTILALRHDVAIGAHPGFADRENFGRRELPLSGAEIAALVIDQTRALQEIALTLCSTVSHVKLHGALYNLVSRNRPLATVVVEALAEVDARVALFVLSGSELEKVARAKGGRRVIAEVFADRTYQRDGSLTPRSQPGALIEDEDQAVAQALRLVQEGKVRATDGTDVAITADTLCLHGDGAHAVAFAKRINEEFRRAGIEIRAW